ncbi:MAG: hypothetical protein H0W53_24655 [Acidobacteria bacterium]|nr:hypothetical protein [Acidobacteriota bacterium]
MDILRKWAQTLADRPLGDFYATATAPDHLPGDLWILKVMAEVFGALGAENFSGTPFLFALKLIPAIADVLVGTGIFLVVAIYRPHTLAVRATAMYMLNPASVFLSSVWGQWDAVSVALLLGGFLLIRWHNWLWVLSAPLLTWAILIKPQLAILMPLLLLLPLVRVLRDNSPPVAKWSRLFLEAAFAAFLGLATMLAIILPFAVGLPGMGTRWSLPDRFSVALDLYPFTTLGAFNLWMIPLGSLDRVSDLDTSWLSLSANRWGMVLFGLAMAAVGARVLRLASRHAPWDLVLWGALAASLAVFTLPTRVHERYLFPAFVFAILYAAVRGFPRHLTIIAIALSLTLLINLAMLYGHPLEPLPDLIASGVRGVGFRAVALANVIVLAIVLTLPTIASPLDHRNGARDIVPERRARWRRELR